MGEGRPLEYLLNGVKVPGVTTITGAFMSRERTNILINWGKSQGRKGAEPEQTKESAGRVGAAIHAMITAQIEQRPPMDELRRGEATYNLMVRAYVGDTASRSTRGDTQYQAQTAVEYVFDRLEAGWMPTDGELPPVTILDPRPGSPPTPRHPA